MYVGIFFLIDKLQTHLGGKPNNIIFHLVLTRGEVPLKLEPLANVGWEMKGAY